MAALYPETTGETYKPGSRLGPILVVMLALAIAVAFVITVAIGLTLGGRFPF